MTQELKHLAFVYDGSPFCHYAKGVAPKAGDIIGEARVRTVFSWPGAPNEVIVILEVRPESAESPVRALDQNLFP